MNPSPIDYTHTAILTNIVRKINTAKDITVCPKKGNFEIYRRPTLRSILLPLNKFQFPSIIS
jgi:hypothetical protein